MEQWKMNENFKGIWMKDNTEFYNLVKYYAH